MKTDLENLKRWLADMATVIEQEENTDFKYYDQFVQEPQLAIELIGLLSVLNDSQIEADNSYYTACVFAMSICIAQLQVSLENGNKVATKTLEQVMTHLAQAIARGEHRLNFWLPILNAFYEVNVELSPALKNAYRDIAMEENDSLPSTESERLDKFTEILDDLGELTPFDIAESIFAQSYAMPADFFSDLIIDLYQIEGREEVGLLCLLHPQPAVREVAVATIEELINEITLSSVSLSRLKAIKNWYPARYHNQFDRWIRIQRKKGVVFATEKNKPAIDIKASEIDGNGAQGLIIHIKEGKLNRFCGLLVRNDYGIKETWVTGEIPADKIVSYYRDAFHFSVTLRKVDIAFLEMITNHFLAITVSEGRMPNLHLLEIQEILGLQFQLQRMDLAYLLEQLSVQVRPFTPEGMQSSLKRSGTWMQNKAFTGSWYIENPHVDQIVNRYCSFVNGKKVCDKEEALLAVLNQELEFQRPYWLYHFFMTALWLKPGANKREKMWQDSFFIAHAINSGMALEKIPIMEGIAYQTVFNSLQTMAERRTHLGEISL